MVQSMTGFGSSEKDGCRVEIRSINHRFLEVYMKCPSFLSQLEVPFRNLLKGTFSRGKFDIYISVSEQASAEFVVNTDLAARICSAFRKMQEELSIGGELDINTLVSLHDMFIEADHRYDLESVTGVFREALTDLHSMRCREGESLAEGLVRMVDALSAMNDRINASCEGILQGVVSKFSERMKVLLDGREVDESRLLQEAAIAASRLDISEEITRIESHIAQLREILAGSDIMGRKIDFILQELNREVNTIASKSVDYGISALTVDMKTEIEKIREQVQNIQ